MDVYRRLQKNVWSVELIKHFNLVFLLHQIGVLHLVNGPSPVKVHSKLADSPVFADTERAVM